MGDSDSAPTRPTRAPEDRPAGDFGFAGTFLSEDIALEGSLQIQKNKVILWAAGAQLASWKSPDCIVRRLAGDQFSIEADNEMITFTADDPEGLIDAISALARDAVPGEAAFQAEAKRAAPASSSPDTPVAMKSEPGAKGPGPVTARHLDAPAAKSSPIRRPRIKAFEARSAEADVTKGASSVATESSVVAKAPPAPTKTPGPSKTPGRRTKARPKTRLSPAPTPQAPPPPAPDQTHASASPASAALTTEAPVAPGAAPVVDADKEPLTIADRITATARRRYRSTKAHRWLKSDIEDVAVKAGVVASAIGIFALIAITGFMLAGGFRGEPEFVPVSTTTLPTAPTTTAVTTTSPPPPTTLFQTGPAELTDRWNALAEQSRPELALFTDLRTSFLVSLTPYVTLEGLLDPTAGSVVIRAAPTGTPEGDGLILTSFGLLIGMSDPTLDGSDRRVLLETLGLAIQDPQLGGLDGTVNHNGLVYHLVYLEGQGVLEFRITPETVPITTETTP